jgi:hypothetical protein
MPAIFRRPQIEPGDIVQEVAVPGVHPVEDSGYFAVLSQEVPESIVTVYKKTLLRAIADELRHLAKEAFEDFTLEERSLK